MKPQIENSQPDSHINKIKKKDSSNCSVAVVKCPSYEQHKVDKAIRNALRLIKFDPLNRTKVLIKPNVVMLSQEKGKQNAITTHPSLIEAVCKFLKENECRIYIGESSFMNTECALKQTGIAKIAKKYKAKLLIFEQEKFVNIKDKHAKILKKFPVARILKEVDYIIDMPKMKTHTLTHASLGIKNLYGLIPGGLKQRLHNKAKNEKFSEILVDIYQNFPPQLTILDGIIGMEGHGPASGIPKHAGLILASKNTIALDIAASKIMGFKPNEIPTIRFAIQRKLYPDYNFQLVGIKNLPLINFKKPWTRKELSKAMISTFKEKSIVCDTTKCIKCGICAKHCPAKAIKLSSYPIVNKKKCIRCFCCMEICPKHALSLKEN